MSRERLRVTVATYRGEDSKGRPFQITAGSAVQKSSQDPIVKLNDLNARIQMTEGPATMTAGVDVEALGDMLDERVRIVSVNHAPSQNGLVNDVVAIGDMLRMHGSPASAWRSTKMIRTTARRSPRRFRRRCALRPMR